MSYSESLIELIILANNTWPKIAGQLFSYDTKLKRFTKLKCQKKIESYKFRWVILLIFALMMFLRALDYWQISKQYRSQNVTTNFNLAIMVTLVPILVAGFCRTRDKSPDDYIEFLNGILDIRTHIEGSTAPNI